MVTWDPPNLDLAVQAPATYGWQVRAHILLERCLVQYVVVAHRVSANSERCGYTPTSSKMSSQGGVGAFSLCIVLPLNYLSEWSPMERRAPAQWFVTRPVSLRSLKTGTTQIPFLLVLSLFIALVCSTTVSLVYMSVHYKVVRNTFVCRALHALGRAAPTLGAPQSLGWAAPRFC